MNEAIFISHGKVTHVIERAQYCESCLEARLEFEKALEAGLVKKLKAQIAAYENCVQGMKGAITIHESNLNHRLKEI